MQCCLLNNIIKLNDALTKSNSNRESTTMRAIDKRDEKLKGAGKEGVSNEKEIRKETTK